MLFDEGANHTYLAQSGLVGGPFPTHASGFTVQPGVRTLGDGKQVQLVMEAVEGGVKLTKTFTFKRGDYVIDVRHDVANVGAAPVTPQLYLQLTHDGNKPVGDSFFNSSFTGPTLYTPQDKYQKLTFEKIEKAAVEDEKKGNDNAMKGLHPATANGGWFAISQHFFVSAFVPPENAKRDIFTEEGRHQPVRHRQRAAIAYPGARRYRPAWTASCTRVRKSRICSKRSRLAWNWSRITAG